MNIKRFYAATAREALAKARMTFGEQTVILSNRTTPDVSTERRHRPGRIKSTTSSAKPTKREAKRS